MSFWDLLQQLHKDVAWLNYVADFSDSSFAATDSQTCIFTCLCWQLPRSCHTSGRDVFNEYLGNTGYKFVALGNLFCSRLALAIILCFAKGIRFVVEQPEGSTLPMHPRFQQVLAIGHASWSKFHL